MRRGSLTKGVAVVVVAAVMMVSSCADSDDDVSEAGGSPSEAPAVSSAASDVGGSVTVMGVLGGDPLEAFLAAFAPFEEATGIEVEYEGTQDLLAVLQTRLDGGNPPDIVSNPSAGQMQDLAAAG